MSLFRAIVLGVVHGLTEFLPVSSSAHLIVLPWLLGWEEPDVPFDAALHLGTLAAVVVALWRDLLGLARALPRAVTRPRRLLRDPEPGRGRRDHPAAGDARLALLLAVATVPGLLAGVVGQPVIETFYHPAGGPPRRAIVAVAVATIALGALLGAAERSAAHQRRVGHLTWYDAVAIGLAQATALIPGVSRAGATITAGLFQGLHRADAARFSLLLAIPILAAGGGKGVWDARRAGLGGAELDACVAGGVASALAGFAAIWGLLRVLRRSGTGPFVLYRMVFGGGLLLLIATGGR